MGGKYQNIHADIINRCLKGDRYAQNELYRLYAKAMFNICYRITNDTSDAEDVLQESFVSAFKNLKSYEGTASFGAWLKRIVINRAINFVRRRQIDFVPFEGQERYDEDQHDAFEGSLSVKAVNQALEKLPAGYRVVFSLYLLEGYDHSEIAEVLGITTSTSKSQYNRAKKKIRELLQKEGSYERQSGKTGKG